MIKADAATAPPSAPAASPTGSPGGWESAGRKIAPMLGSYSAAVVTSSDALAAAHVAIGIGLAEAEHRRVAIADLVGEVEPIQSLVTSEDPHGISDSFTYGVSLNKIAQPIDTTGNLFVMPSGTGSVAEPAIFTNSRWQRLANGFREVGALLLIVAPADAPRLKDLIDQTDGVVLVGGGGTPLDLAPYINVLARVPAPAATRPAPRIPVREPQPVWRIAALLLAVVAVLGTGYFLWSSQGRSTNTARGRLTPPAARPAAAGGAGPAVGAVAAPVGGAPRPGAVAPETLAVAPPANVADSATATAYAVELGAWNAIEDAVDQINRYRSSLPAATIAPVPLGASREIYYKVISGAFPNPREAQVLLDVLRHKGVVLDGMGTLVRTPYALLLDSASAGRTQTIMRKYSQVPQSRQSIYVLAQDDGSLRVYAGAFERPEDSASLMASLRAAGLSPVLAYRTGRSP